MEPRPFLEQLAAAPLARAVVRVRGEKALSFLHDVSTQELADLRVGDGALTCFLDDKGRVQAEARALMLGDEEVLLDAEPSAAPYLTGWLARIAPLSGCEVIDETSSWHVTAVRGPDAATAVGVTRPPAEHSFEQRDELLVVRIDWAPPGVDVLSRSPISIDVSVVDADAFEAARIAAGRPRFGIDITSDDLINETPLLSHAVAMEKGCYPGQESVARVHNLGRIRRHLVGLTAESDILTGGAVRLDDREVGVVTSAADRAAIARVRAEVQPGAVVHVDGTEAVARAL